jgi:hypothetical protein
MIEELVGTWRWTQFEVVSADGQASLPFGPDPVGYLSYTPDGFMFVTLRCAERPRLGTQAWIDWTPEQMARAGFGYLSYCGRYEVVDDRIEHHVEHSLLPEWVGTTKTRYARLEGDRMLLSTVPVGSTGVSHSRGVLERAT